ncbi:MAG: tetratricopeptide repeat protein [Candidatus Sabulitectum sp.]|nr:tetratricopeptide repeat protein [Candidatus Sabulitectum sp.]
MDRDKEKIADHLPLEEVIIADIDGIDAPENWSRPAGDDSPEVPPVVVEEDRGFSLVGNHRTVWHLKSSGKIMVKCLVVRSLVHVKPAHLLISNCTEEAMLFESLLKRGIVSNRSRLADMLGYSRARITQLLNQLKLPLNIRQKVLLTDDVSEFKLRPLLKFLDDEAKLQAGFKKLMEGKLSGRQMAVFANSDSFEESTDISDNSGNEVKKKPLDISLDDTENSIAELEDVFAGCELESTSPEEGAVPPVIKQLSPEKHSILEQAEKPFMVEMAGVLRELGSIRDAGWRIRAAEYMLSPPEMEFLEGVSRLRGGLYKEAMTILEKIVSDDPDYHLAWFYLGRCSNLTGSLQEAEEYLRNAISRCPGNPDYQVELAIVLEKLKRHSEAEAFYRKSAIIRKALAVGK